MTHRKYLWIFLLVMAVLEGLLVALWTWAGDMMNLSASIAFSMVLYMLSMGFYGAIIICDMVFSEQYKSNTLKNEVSYGLSRVRIYLGKLVVSGIVALGICAVILAWYGILCALLLAVDGAWLTAMESVGFALLVAVPLWLGALALTNMLFFLVKSSTAASLIAVSMFAFVGQAIQLMAFTVGNLNEPVGKLLFWLYDINLTTPLKDITNRIGDWSLPPQAWAVGIGWLVVTTLIGLAAFSKKEIS